MTDSERADSLQDLLRGFSPMYTWTVSPPVGETGFESRVFRVDLTDGRAELSWLVTRQEMTQSALSWWDFAKSLAERMVGEFKAGSPV